MATLTNSNYTSPNIQPKRWGVKNMRLVIGTGPYTLYRKLLKNQYGIIFRTYGQAHIIAVAASISEVRGLLRRLERDCPDDFPNIGFKREESIEHPPIPRIAKIHFCKRRRSYADMHRDWWKPSVGFPKNLNPPERVC